VTEELSVEATGETVGEAKWAALRELERMSPGLDKSAVRFQVVAEGERGLLGVGYTPARVVATVTEDGSAVRVEQAPSDESEPAALVRELVTHITAGIGVQCQVDVEEREDAVVATCSGRDLGLLIGRHGQTIDAVQYLVNAILARRLPGTPTIVDAAGYRARREASLSAIAHRAADDALRRGDRVELEPMTAVERKIVHLELKDAAGVETTSEGTEPNRFVVVFPAATSGPSR
jgi:spoIIIJ-associated protein